MEKVPFNIEHHKRTLCKKRSWAWVVVNVCTDLSDLVLLDTHYSYNSWRHSWSSDPETHQISRWKGRHYHWTCNCECFKMFEYLYSYICLIYMCEYKHYDKSQKACWKTCLCHIPSQNQMKSKIKYKWVLIICLKKIISFIVFYSQTFWLGFEHDKAYLPIHSASWSDNTHISWFMKTGSIVHLYLYCSNRQITTNNNENNKQTQKSIQTSMGV